MLPHAVFEFGSRGNVADLVMPHLKGELFALMTPEHASSWVSTQPTDVDAKTCSVGWLGISCVRKLGRLFSMDMYKVAASFEAEI